MQILAAPKRSARKYYYQLDNLKLSTDQKQYNTPTVTGETEWLPLLK